MFIERQLKHIHQLLVLFFLLKHYFIVLLSTQSPKLMVGLDENVLSEGLKRLAHLGVDFETDTRDDFAYTVGFA
jgi:hypothetical protein